MMHSAPSPRLARDTPDVLLDGATAGELVVTRRGHLLSAQWSPRWSVQIARTHRL